MAAAGGGGDGGSDSAATVAARLARDINCLTDADKFKRKRALATLVTALLDAPDAPVFDVAVAVLMSSVAKAAAAALADGAELVREAAAVLFTRFLAKQVELGGHALHAALLPVLLPAIVARVGKTPFPEESEEQRLKLATLLTAVISAAPAAAGVRAATAAVVEVLVALASDAFPAVKLESAKGVAILAAVNPGGLHAFVRPLAASQVAALGHQRGPVRLAALDALAAVVPLGAEGLPRLLVDVVLPAMQAARHDRTASVRRALAGTVAAWLAALPRHALEGDDAFDAQLLYHAAGLAADDAAEVSLHAVEALDASVAAAAADGAAAGGGGVLMTADLAVAAEAAAVDGVAAMSMAGGGLSPPAPSRAAGAAAPHAAHGAPAAAPAPPPWDTLLPPPFNTHTVPAATTAFVAARLPRVMPLLLRDLKEWTARTRLFAAGALRSLLVLGRAAMTAHLGDVVAALCAGSRDDDADVRRLLGDAGRLLGVYVPADAQLGVLIPQLRGEVAGLNNGQHAAAALAVLAAALSSMSPATLGPHLAVVADTLALPALADDDPPQLRLQLAGALFSLVRCGVPAGGADIAAAEEAARPRALRRTARAVSCDDDADGGAVADVAGAKAAAAGAAALAATAHAAVTTAGGALLDAAVVDAMLTTVLRLADAAASDDVAALATEAARMLAHRTHYRHTAACFADAAGRLLPRLTADAGSWSKAALGRRAFDAMLRVARPALAGRSRDDADALMASVVSTFVSTLAPAREPELRLAMLATLDALIIGDNAARAARAGARAAAAAAHTSPSAALATGDVASPRHADTDGEAAAAARAALPAHLHLDVPVVSGAAAVADAAVRARVTAHTVSNAAVDAALSRAAGRIVREALLPNLVWRVGAVPATIRKVALACLLSMARGGFLSQDALLPLWSEARPVVAGCLADDDASTRHMATALLATLFTLLYRAVDDDTVHTLYTELLKRLDDSSDPVRCAACNALAALAASAPPALLTGGTVHYVIDALLVHVDDTVASVQHAAFDCLQRWCRLDAVYADRVLRVARDRHRYPAFADRLLELVAPLLPPAAAPAGGAE